MLSFPMIKSLYLTVAEVCTQTRTKSVFCNSSDNCAATGIIVSLKSKRDLFSSEVSIFEMTKTF